MEQKPASLAASALKSWRLFALAVFIIALLIQGAARVPGHAGRFAVIAALLGLAFWAVRRVKRPAPRQIEVEPGPWPWLRRAGWLSLGTAAGFVGMVAFAWVTDSRSLGQQGRGLLQLAAVATLVLGALWLIGWVFLAPTPSTEQKRRRMKVWTWVCYGLGLATLALGVGLATAVTVQSYFDFSPNERGWMILTVPLTIGYAVAFTVPVAAVFAGIGALIAWRRRRL